MIGTLFADYIFVLQKCQPAKSVPITDRAVRVSEVLRSLALTAAVCATLAGCAARRSAARRFESAGTLTQTGPGNGAPRQPASEPSEQDIINEFQPDRPDVANATHVVPVALAQLEAGGEWDRADAGSRSAGTPLSLRIGLREWLEARIESDGVSYEKDSSGSSLTFNGLSLGAKVRFSEAFAVIPAVNLPVGGKAGTDYSLTLITGSDFAGRNHVDANYGMAASGVGEAGFFQQWAAVSVNRQVTDALSPYIELAWFSRQDPGGGRLVSMDGGFIYTVNERFAFDAGAGIGLSSAAPQMQVFAGLSTILGELHGHRGVHGRLRDAALRHARDEN